ncbi:hypothetical protein [Dactylosporangium matsuzakiense]|uniref:hypothetical protein n=1 Tax=Dactylosporangium matsuzakiense TaxID=53360 RepID=UPI0021C311AB|nr:hypothetical protein [Dactylosporangium matsuzakiense]UWZ47460.1 hypothetical protein Dmats_14260 [Dactylosporangium matsuzakiense]
MSLKVWGTRPEETALAFGGDAVVPGRAAYYRAVDVHAPAPVAFRRLCQLRVAPYSYDWIDNRGRRSPRALTPGVEDLATGQRWMTIFTLIAFVPGEQLTFRITRRDGRALFGDIVVTYVLRELGPRHCRLVAKLHLPEPRGLLEAATRPLLCAGDLVMMRRQLLNLAALAREDDQGQV